MPIPIKFFGIEYILIGTLQEGAITTQEQYDTFSDSYAHLFPDGTILRYGSIIGTLSDIEVINATEDQTS